MDTNKELNLGPNEEIIQVMHQHPIFLAPVIASSTLLLIADFFGFYMLGRYHDSVESIAPASIISIFLLAIVVFIVVILLISIYVYRQTRLVLTNENLIEILQAGLFDRKVSVLNLTHIEDVNGRCKGLIATTLGYGQLEVETASSEENFVFGPVSGPYPMAEKISRAHQDMELGRFKKH